MSKMNDNKEKMKVLLEFTKTIRHLMNTSHLIMNDDDFLKKINNALKKVEPFLEKLPRDDNTRTIRTSILISKNSKNILDTLLNARYVNSISEAIQKIIDSWSKTDKGKEIILKSNELTNEKIW